MKPFYKQYQECSQEGFLGVGDFLSFEEHPELLPAFPKTSVIQAIKNGDWKGIEKTRCLRFGGICGSKHLDCQKMRKNDKENL